jgi:signal transduction histidine kinase
MEPAFYFPPEYLRAGLLVSLLSVWLLVGLFAYLNHYTRRRYFTLWMVAWLFYALWLTLNFAQELHPHSRLLQMCRQWSVGTSAVFLFWGSLVFMGHRVRQTLLGLFMLFLLVWSYVGVYHVNDPLQAKLPIFLMLGLASFRAAFCFFRYRCKRQYIGASLLAVGLLLWGVYLGGYPFWEAQRQLQAVSFFLCGVLQLFIAVSMIVLVLEEARATLQRVLETNRSNREACAGLQQQVRSSEDRYRKLFEQASDGIVITNTSGLDILEMNQRAKRLLILPRFEPGHHSLRSFLEGVVPGCGGASGPELFERIRLHRTLHLVASDGAKTPVEAEAMAIEFEGQPAFQFAFRELTERVRLEQQLRQSEKLSALGQMISGIAHELNNPLAVIKGYLDLILSHHPLHEHTRSDLQKVAHESSRATKLVRNFLSFAREQPTHRAAVDINQLVERVVELRRFDLRATAVEIRLELTPDLPPALADAEQIQQVLINLINNAVQALSETSHHSRAGLVRLRTDRVNGTVRLFVEDDGPGVPKHLESKIFEPFFTTKEVGKGTGLGLSIAHSILSEHRGRVYYQASPLGGACFVLELPVANVQAPEHPAPPAPAVPAPTTSTAQPKAPPLPPANILILDDERALAEMLGQMVHHLGHRGTLCCSPLEALERLAQEDFDLILSDYRMPVLDGQQFYRRVAQLKPRLAPKIIFLTGDALNEETHGFLSSIDNACIIKPFQLGVVESAVNRVLQERPSPVRPACAQN